MGDGWVQVVTGLGTVRVRWQAHAHVYGHGDGQPVPTRRATFPLSGIPRSRSTTMGPAVTALSD